jgi:hypothetical protein
MTMKIKQIINSLNLYGNIEMIGSNSIKNMKYKTDYDLQEHVTIKNTSDYIAILETFQYIFKLINNSENIFITDFKSGVFNTYPVRWNYDDIMKGYKDIDTKNVQFVDTLHNNNNTIKIDVLALVDKAFVEISCNYYFTNSTVIFDDTNVDDDTILSFMLDIKKYYHEKKYFKMMKRVMSLRTLKNENVDNFIKLFNSDAGLLYQIIHKIDVVEFILENRIKFNINDVNSEIDNIMKSIPNDVIKQLTKHDDVFGLLAQIKSILIEQTNKDVMEFIKND